MGASVASGAFSWAIALGISYGGEGATPSNTSRARTIGRKDTGSGGRIFSACVSGRPENGFPSPNSDRPNLALRCYEARIDHVDRPAVPAQIANFAHRERGRAPPILAGRDGAMWQILKPFTVRNRKKSPTPPPSGPGGAEFPGKARPSREISRSREIPREMSREASREGC